MAGNTQELKADLEPSVGSISDPLQLLDKHLQLRACINRNTFETWPKSSEISNFFSENEEDFPKMKRFESFS